MSTYLETPFSFNTPRGFSFTDYCTKEPKRGDWIPNEECHYIVIRRREDGSFDLADHPREDDITDRILDTTVSHDRAFANARAIATDPATVAAVLAAHPE